MLLLNMAYTPAVKEGRPESDDVVAGQDAPEALKEVCCTS